MSAFYTHKKEWVVEEKDNGTFPGFDYGTLAEKQQSGGGITPADFTTRDARTSWIATTVREHPGRIPATRGPCGSRASAPSTSFERDRDLLVTQLNGDHTIEQVPGLHASWAANYAKTTQNESALGTRIFFEPRTIRTSFPSQHASRRLPRCGPGASRRKEQWHPRRAATTSTSTSSSARFDTEYQRMICPIWST